MSVADWFRVRGRSLQSISFSLHRLTGLVLFIYLLMHLSYLTSLKLGKEVYESLIATTVSPAFLPFDILLLLATIFHGVNGIRVVLNEFGIGYEARKAMLYAAYLITAILWIIASVAMYNFVVGVR
jgi:succinate dehydrogenase / fumarate reductase cytochrome b subunit